MPYICQWTPISTYGAHTAFVYWGYCWQNLLQYDDESPWYLSTVIASDSLSVGQLFFELFWLLGCKPAQKPVKIQDHFFSSSTLGHFLWNWKWNDVIREFCPLLYFVKCIFNRFGNLYGINPTDLSVGRWRRKNVKAISFWSTTTPGRPRAPFVADDHIASFLLSTTSTEHSSDLLKLVKSVRFSSSWKCDARDGTLLFPSSLEDEIIQLKFYEQNVLKCSARLRHRNKDLEST